MAFAHSFDIDLHSSVKHCHIAVDLYKIQCIKFINSTTVGIPDLGIHRTCLILYDQIFIRLSVFGHG